MSYIDIRCNPHQNNFHHGGILWFCQYLPPYTGVQQYFLLRNCSCCLKVSQLPPLVNLELLTFQRHINSPSVFNVIRVCKNTKPNSVYQFMFVIFITLRIWYSRPHVGQIHAYCQLHVTSTVSAMYKLN